MHNVLKSDNKNVDLVENSLAIIQNVSRYGKKGVAVAVAVAGCSSTEMSC